MFLGLLKELRFVPIEYKHDIYQIDFNKYYSNGKRLILIDLDNTLMSYKDTLCSLELKELISRLKLMGFEIIIASNNFSKKRVENVANQLDLKYIYRGMKPLRKCYRKALKIASQSYKKSEVITIGDQLTTDIYSSNRFGFDSILVKPVDKKTDKFSTKILRRIERKAIRKIYKKYPDIYQDKLELFVKESGICLNV